MSPKIYTEILTPDTYRVVADGRGEVRSYWRRVGPSTYMSGIFIRQGKTVIEATNTQG